MAKKSIKVAEQVLDFTSMTAIESLTREINFQKAVQEEAEAKAAPYLDQADNAKENIKTLNEKLAQAMITQNRHNVFNGGFQFTLKHNPPSFEIANEKLALEWAQQNNCLRIDTTKAKTLLKREILTPGGFVRNDSITVSRMAEKSVEEK